ncbi:hypothetical protein QOZ80_3AG0220820 [Eleusine coracana subsp. coracana]|nr:hypothetical protein QOZ80_3AG0220820 [Eleusine coracana subsp. coracana]
MGRLVLLVSIFLLSAAMSNGIRTVGTVAAGAPGPAAATTQQTAVHVATPPVAAAAATTVTSSEQQPPLDDPYKDSKRKVPNGPDPIHNRRARWGDAPARRV